MRFDVIVESAREGIRKPSRGIYEIALERLDVRGYEAIYLDDLGVNLKPPKEMGMITIRVLRDHHDALRELQKHIPFPILPPSVIASNLSSPPSKL